MNIPEFVHLAGMVGIVDPLLEQLADLLRDGEDPAEIPAKFTAGQRKRLARRLQVVAERDEVSDASTAALGAGGTTLAAECTLAADLLRDYDQTQDDIDLLNDKRHPLLTFGHRFASVETDRFGMSLVNVIAPSRDALCEAAPKHHRLYEKTNGSWRRLEA